jgi:hypothetical protein
MDHQLVYLQLVLNLRIELKLAKEALAFCVYLEEVCIIYTTVMEMRVSSAPTIAIIASLYLALC